MSRLDDIRRRLDQFVATWQKNTTSGFGTLIGTLMNDLDAILKEQPGLSLDLVFPAGFTQTDRLNFLEAIRVLTNRYGVYELESRMACPTCDKTMSPLGCKVTDQTAYLCPVCGTFRDCEGGEPVVPDLVRRCREYAKNVGLPEWTKREWARLGIHEAINVPKDRPR